MSCDHGHELLYSPDGEFVRYSAYEVLQRRVAELEAIKVQGSVNRLVRVLCERIAAGEYVQTVLNDYGIDQDAFEPVVNAAAEAAAELVRESWRLR